MIASPTIMKQNPLILAEFERAFSEVDHDVVNILLHSLQNELKLDNSTIDLFNCEQILDRKVLIRARKFKDHGKFGINANKDIFESLMKIKTTAAVIRNFTDIDGTFVKAKSISIIDDIRWIEAGHLEDKREQSFEIQFNEWFLKVSTKNFNMLVGNFTNLSLGDTVDIKSKYAKKLYEILKAKEYRETSFSLKYEDMQKLFNLEGKSFAYINQVLRRIKPMINNFIDFEYEVFKKDKLISFKYNSKKVPLI